jgi:DNA-binding response OmpR family regulator
LIDRRSHRIHFRRSALSLARRPVLRRLLYTLALRPNASVSKERLAQAIWDCDYHPLRHDNPLKVNVRELRRLLDRTELSVTFDGEGYKLLVPVGFVFLDQFDWISKAGGSELSRASQLGSGFPHP